MQKWLLMCWFQLYFSSCMQMLDRYVQDSAENAHPSSEDGSYASDTDSQATVSNESEEDLTAEAKNTAHLARLDMADAAVENRSVNDVTAAGSHGADYKDLEDQHGQQMMLSSEHAVEQADSGHQPRNVVSDRHQGSEEATEQMPVDLPDHVVIRSKATAARTLPCSHKGQDFDDSQSVVSHSTQIPSQEAVQQRVIDQQRSRMRRQVLARASRNAQKVGSKKERKQTADAVNW